MASNQDIKGLAKAADIYGDRFKRAKELQAGGKKVFGYFCCYPPLELMTALDILPFRIMGSMDEPITDGDAHLPPVMCIFYRSCFDLAKKGLYDFFDGFIGAHACDGAERISHIWRYHIKAPCNFYLDIPHTTHAGAVEFFKTQINYYKEALEEYVGKKVTPESLGEAIDLHNRQRGLVRELYNLRKPDPPLISGSEVLQVMMALMFIPVEEGSALLTEVIEEVKTRRNPVEKKTGRILIWGSLIDNSAFTDVIEGSGLNIVIEDTAIGMRPFWHDIEKTVDPLQGLTEHYLVEVLCPRTFRETGPSYKEDLENRFGYLRDFAKHWNVNGVYLNLIRNCDIHGYEVPTITDFFENEVGLPVLLIEQDYSRASLEPIRTRFQAFSEAII
ncbi:2-hydroxyacyl-CoA dehydratase subunit D [Thermodesulfobacteriota bacterium]